MLEDQSFEHGLRGLAFLVVELLQRLELQAQGVVGAALIFIEQQEDDPGDRTYPVADV